MNKHETLVLMDSAKNQLAKITTIDDAKGVRDKAEALRVYSKQTEQGLEIQNQCAEIKIRAERRAGEILKNMADKDERAGGHGGDRKSSDTLSLEELGVTNKQSSRWQTEASVPEDVFEAHIAWQIITPDQPSPIGCMQLTKKGLWGKSYKNPTSVIYLLFVICQA